MFCVKVHVCARLAIQARRARQSPGPLVTPRRGGVVNLKVWLCGSALRGPSRTEGASFELGDGFTLRLRDRFAPSRPSSTPSWGVSGLTMGEYGRGVWENEDTCSSMTYSWVAFVSLTMLDRSSDDSGCEVP